ncbi:MAG: uracil-DNA glycosylase family protein [Azoarcus sp.]|jgi:hypothetical protein|nr:uracil-DNA glycosylase family protein [Azoarcus sp.]
MDKHLFRKFAPVIRSLSAKELDGAASLYDKLTIAEDQGIRVCYAPFEYINESARVVIAGITPGHTQMLNALKEVRRQLDRNTPEDKALKAAKDTGAFSGSMRPNLTSLLDSIGIQRWLGIRSCDELFGNSAHLVQTTSVLRYPVFVGDKKNYAGTPNMIRHPLLRDQLTAHFAAEAAALPDAVFVPLGDKVAEALFFLAEKGSIKRERILDGLPHPSGANAERIAYFLGRKERSALSSKTSPDKIDGAKEKLLRRVRALS